MKRFSICISVPDTELASAFSIYIVQNIEIHFLVQLVHKLVKHNVILLCFFSFAFKHPASQFCTF